MFVVERPPKRGLRPKTKNSAKSLPRCWELGETGMKSSELSKHYAYMLRCADGTIYSGYSTDPNHRVAVHNSGKGAKYTRSRLPVELVFTEDFPTKSEALKREAALKKLGHAEKLALISSAT